MLGLLGRHAPSLIALYLVPIAVCMVGGAWDFALRSAICAVPVVLLPLITRKIDVPASLRSHEALATVALVFLIAAAGMTWPFMTYGLGPLDAFFEAMSGVTSTGFTKVADIEAWPWPAQIARAWTQWYGGFVILTVVVALLMQPGPTAQRLGIVSVHSDNVIDQMNQRARKVLIVYAVITVIAILLSYAALRDPVAAVALSLTAVSTGGFSIYNDSLASIPVPGIAILGLFCILTAIPIGQLFRIRDLRPLRILKHPEVGALVVLMALGAVALCLLEWLRAGVPSLAKAGDLLFAAVSAQTTAGFSTGDISTYGTDQKMVLIAMMFVGGALGSTAGGVKIFRFLVLTAVLRQNIFDTSVGPNTLTTARVASARVHDDEIDGAITTLLLFLAVHFISILAIAADGVPLIDAAFDVVSAVSTVGLSAGVAGPEASDFTTAVLILNMWLGRLEVLAVVILFNPWFWFRKG